MRGNRRTHRAGQIEALIEICAPVTDDPEEFVQQLHREPVFIEAMRMWPRRSGTTTH